MGIVRTKPIQKQFHNRSISTSEIAIVSEKEFRTRGENFIIVKDVDSCKILLDYSTTDYVTIKALTNVLILPSIGKIDEEFDEVLISKGACVEFVYTTGNWYIMSSDGLKQS
jgi:hypothetical protein